MSRREVMLVGGVPLKPATTVFECIHRHHLAPLMQRIPDGEQAGWAAGFWRFTDNPSFEIADSLMMTTRETTFFADNPWPLFRLKEGISPAEVDVGPLGVAESAITSWSEFKQFKSDGKFEPETRFCVTLAGPGSSFGFVDMPHQDLYPLVEDAFRKEIGLVLDAIPHNELAIQLDLAGEVELEELRRRPDDFDMPLYRKTEPNWPMDECISMIANIANSIPEEVELGFHLCAIWHIDQSQGQDLNVHVDWCNELSRKITRPIGYIHVPTTLDYTEEDFLPLERLNLKTGTKLFIGLVHAEDGAEGAQNRVKAAAAHYRDFGIASFCGLTNQSLKEYQNPHSVDEIMDMHLAAAETVID